MGTIFKYIKDFYSREFNIWYFLLLLLIAGIVIYLNYFHSLELKYTSGPTWWGRFAGQYLIYFIPFAAAFLLQPLFIPDCTYFSSKWFWAILLLAPAIFAFRAHFDFHRDIIYNLFDNEEERQYVYKSLGYIIRLLFTLIPVFIIWFIKDRKEMPFYGTASLDNIRPYLIMLLIMVPLIVLASTQNDFLQTYPKAKFLSAMNIGQQKWRWLVYEICYGIDFITIEFFFRGFLILALFKICGMHSILPAAIFYCTIHLGKPMGECISSFWGGLLLGIVSYNNFSIWGGLIVHLGIAWMMEIGGWLGGVIKFAKR